MKPNIIFVLLDGSRWDRLDKSPDFLDLIKKGTLANNVTTAIPYTFGAMNVIFTGLYGKENGVDAYYKMFDLKDSVNFLPEILQKNDYFTCCDVITDKVISKRGFDIHQAHDEYKDDLTIKHPNFLKQIFNESKGKPVFCFLQFSRIHTVTVSEILKKYEWDDKKFYEKTQENMKTYDHVFDEAGKYAKIIYDTLEEMNKTDETILIFFADHGTGIGERFGERNYGIFTFEETIRTFYLFLGADFQKGVKTEKLLSTIDIFPTLLDTAKIDYKFNTIGDSIVPFLKGDKELENKKYTFSETGGLQGPFPSPKEPNVFCIKTTTHKLIYYKKIDKWLLFDLVTDPKEENNIYEQQQNISTNLKKKLLDWIDR